jgi:hypothetical protein
VENPGILKKKFTGPAHPGQCQPTSDLKLGRQPKQPEVDSTRPIASAQRKHIECPKPVGHPHRVPAEPRPRFPTIHHAPFHLRAPATSPLSAAEPKQISLLLPFPILPLIHVALHHSPVHLAFDESPPTSSPQAATHSHHPPRVKPHHPEKLPEP